MPNKMLIDATHPEETRVVVLRGNRVEEFDFESASRKQLRGNIYLAKVTRVEPSLQAAFVDYGGNRHGFLAFSEIHPDYYQIPVADRQALIDEEERAHRDAEAEADRRAGGGRHRRPHHRKAERHRETVRSEPIETAESPAGEADAAPVDVSAAPTSSEHAETPELRESEAPEAAPPVAEAVAADAGDVADKPAGEEPAPLEALAPAGEAAANGDDEDDEEDDEDDDEGPGEDGEEEDVVESVGGADAMEEVPDRMPRLRRQYKIQEVIKRRQIMLVQVVKEERGTKGAALTTYLSLAGRYSVLMPNTARGGGISRKITNVQDRKRLKEIAQELDVPEGMGVILRTAGAARTKTEIKRDFEYLMRLWEQVRDITLNSTAPTLVYEEGSLVKRSIRDLYNKDIDEVVVAGESAYREARDFMRMLMPSHAKNVRPYVESQPVLTRYGIEAQLDAMFSPVVQLRSGGYIVINQAEALVAIDVNSGRATREHHIEDTAHKTNLEAADEVARQLRLRDLAGLIVIDFIDMDEKRNNRSVERRLKECLKNDRARIQVGRISHFGLLEMSRQRIRSSVLESTTDKCPHCGGTGHVRSVSSVALQLLRTIEEQLLRAGTHNLVIRTRADIALYVLNNKRAHLRELEERFRVLVTVNADETLGGQTPFIIDRGEQVHTPEQARLIAAAHPVPAPVAEPEDEYVEEEEAEAIDEVAKAEADEDEGEPGEDREAREDGERGEGNGRRRRRRRRRGRGREDGEAGEARPAFTQDTVAEHAIAHEDHDGDETEEEGAVQKAGETGDGGDAGEGAREMSEVERRRRRRGRRGGRRNRRDPGEGEVDQAGRPLDREIVDAVADLGGPPSDVTTWTEVEPAEAAAPTEPPMRQEAPAEPAPVEAAPRESESKRRSTVREPVNLTGEAPPPPPPAPPVEIAPAPESPAAEEDPNRPRRSGWWSKRVSGG